MESAPVKNYASEILKDLKKSRDLLTQTLADQNFVETVSRATDIVVAALQAGRKILLAGNGGSAADAQHIATELVVRFKLKRPALPAIALTTDSSMLTAIGNDLGFEQLFSRQIEALGQAGDVFFAISTSGRSPNILTACAAARARNLTVVGFTGANGGSMRECCDVLIGAPSDDTPLIQQVHITVGHIICAIAEQALCGESAPQAARPK